MKSVAVVVLVGLAGSGTAHAEPLAAPAAPAHEALSAQTAFGLSFGGTLVSYGLFTIGVGSRSIPLVAAGALGALVLPSAGRWYAHAPAYGGIVLRATAMAAAVGGAAIYVSDCDLFGEGSRCGRDKTAITALLVTGAVTFAGATIYDIDQAPRDALAYNARLRDVTLVPMVQPDRHGYGVALAARF
ncbi:MAG TPA: hypothetical protein VFP84_25665 [Kofleriaceae bacterium]|nr:hypothetical protein [Kofleriaceae bacterium]